MNKYASACCQASSVLGRAHPASSLSSRPLLSHTLSRTLCCAVKNQNNRRASLFAANQRVCSLTQRSSNEAREPNTNPNRTMPRRMPNASRTRLPDRMRTRNVLVASGRRQCAAASEAYKRPTPQAVGISYSWTE